MTREGRLLVAGICLAWLGSVIATFALGWHLGREAGALAYAGVAEVDADAAEERARRAVMARWDAEDALALCESALAAIEPLRDDWRWRVRLTGAYQREVCRGLGVRRLPTDDDVLAADGRLREIEAAVRVAVPDEWVGDL